MNRPPSPTDEPPLAAAVLAALDDAAVSARPGLALAHVHASARERKDGTEAETGSVPSGTPPRGAVPVPAAYDRLRRILARLRRSADPASQALAEQLAADAAAALLALAERAEHADPVARRRREQETARTERLRDRAERARAARGSRDAQR